MPVIVGTNNPETLNGTADADTIFGLGGDDTLNGLGGDDFLDGGAGNDTIFGNAGADSAFLDLSLAGSDTIDLGDGNDLVFTAGTTGQIRLTFTSAEVGNGNVNDSVAGGLNVRLQSENGTDGLVGPQSRVDDEGITFIAASGQAFDVRDTSGIQRGDRFEVVVLGTMAADVMTAVQASRPYYFNGGMGDDSIRGGDNDDFLVGGAGNDTLNGGNGADTFLGGGGNDYLDGGGGGADQLDGGGGNDAIIVDADDTVAEAVGGGFDNVAAKVSYILAEGSEIEVLSTTDNAGTAAINLNGNAFGQVVVGNAGNNYLDGGGGADLLVGLGGNDTLIVDADDTVEEAVGGGFDNVAAKVSYTLGFGDEIEVLSTTDNGGSAAINLTGNEFGQVVVGNAGANTLDGKGGNDVLVGLGGADSFAFTTSLAAAGVDTILGFLAADDTILLEETVFVGLTAGALPAGAFATGTAATEADDRIIYNQATGQLFFDVDGNGVQAQVLFATLQGAPLINASDFTVI